MNCPKLSKTVQNCSETVLAVLAVLPTIPVLGVMCAMHGMRGMPRAPDVHGNHGTHATCGICVMVASLLKPLHTAVPVQRWRRYHHTAELCGYRGGNHPNGWLASH